MEDKDILRYIKEIFKKEGFSKILNIDINNIDDIVSLGKDRFELYVIDESKKKILMLKDKAMSKGLNNVYVYIDNVDSINLKFNYFDGVMCLNQYKNIEEIKKIILKAYDILKSDGILFIEAPKTEDINEYLSIFRDLEMVEFNSSRGNKLIRCIK